MTKFDLKKFYGDYDSEDQIRIMSEFFEYMKSRRGQRVPTVEGNTTLIFDGFVIDHDSLFVACRRDDDEMVSHLVHPCKFSEYERLWESEL